MEVNRRTWAERIAEKDKRIAELEAHADDVEESSMQGHKRIAELEERNAKLTQKNNKLLLSSEAAPVSELRGRIAELEAERDSFHMDYRAKCDEETKRLHVRITELKGQLDLNVDYSKQVAKREARIAEMEGENREVLSVLALLRLHRVGRDWGKPIPSDLLSREDAALAKLGTGGGE